jgi:dipeptidyl aminopeptidase/acylaminoacyl peptidase
MTVADSITMTRLADERYFLGGPSEGRVAIVSPDGTRFVVVLQKGNLETNTNDFYLLLYKTAEAFKSPAPEIVLTLSSSSNRPAIRDVKWLSDNEHVVFIGENSNEFPMLYMFSVDKRQLKKVTTNTTPIVAYDVTADGGEILYEADPPLKKKIDTEQIRRNGIVITTEELVDILAGDCRSFRPTWAIGEQLFLKVPGKDATEIPIVNVLFRDFPISMSPDGRYAIILVHVRQIPEIWSRYQDKTLREKLSEKRRIGEAFSVRQYVLVDTATQRADPLLVAPLAGMSNVAWASDGRSVVIDGTYLPLSVTDQVERALREKKTFVAEVKIPSREIIKVTDQDLRLQKWDQKTGRILLKPVNADATRGSVAFERVGSTWRETAIRWEDTRTNTRVDAELKEDMNTPPKIFVSDPTTKREALLLDLNPQFGDLQFGRVQALSWKTKDGREADGGLYLPPDYLPGRRYALVIQTHGFTKARFWVDGPWSSSFAAQALAGKGVVVLQVNSFAFKDDRDDSYVLTTEEAPRVMANYEGAIDHLDEIGLIDRKRVGIIGFSRTVYYVGYMLTHSEYQFAAATLTDGIDAGYFQAIAFGAGESASLNGGPPFGASLSHWLRNSPAFNLDKVSTPVRLEALGPVAVLESWEWFSGLSQLKKPVDLIYLPYAPHLLIKPWERMVSQQGSVDWFTFWLNGQEDQDPAKAKQYARWREWRAPQGGRVRLENSSK